jgi:hypothetical protein
MRVVLVPACLLLLVDVTGCQKTECGSGTFDENGVCTAGLSPDCGQGTTLVNGQCKPTGGGGVSCGAGTTELNGACVGTVVGRGNMGLVTGLTVVAPSGLADVSPVLDASYTEPRTSFMVVGMVDAQPSDFLWGGPIMPNPLGDRSYVIQPGMAFSSRLTGDVAEPLTLYVPYKDKTIDLIDVHLTGVERGDIDGVPVPTRFDFEGTLTHQAAQVEVESQLTVYNLIMDDPRTVDSDGDGTLDAWKVVGTITVGSLEWVQ